MDPPSQAGMALGRGTQEMVQAQLGLSEDLGSFYSIYLGSMDPCNQRDFSGAQEAFYQAQSNTEPRPGQQEGIRSEERRPLCVGQDGQGLPTDLTPRMSGGRAGYKVTAS